jgi:hypothetical protein
MHYQKKLKNVSTKRQFNYESKLNAQTMITNIIHYLNKRLDHKIDDPQ